MIVGRSSRADLVVDEPLVSREHVQLYPQRDGVWVGDLNSRNGTYVNGARLTSPCLMRPGDRLTIGNTAWRLEWTPDSPRGDVAASRQVSPPWAEASPRRADSFSRSEAPPTATRAAISSQPRSLPGVGCHVRGCHEPVIGQCPGYKGGCGRFYCAHHSSEVFCSICAKQQAYDQALEAMYQDYLAEAERIRGITKGSGVMLVIAILLLTGGLSTIADVPLAGVACFVVGGLLLWGAWWFHRQKARELAQVAAEKPGFREFYNEYLKQRAAANMQNLLVAGLVAGAAASAIQNYQVRKDIHDIAQGMRR
jgi:hypothetical protein